MNRSKPRVLLIGGTSALASEFYSTYSHRLSITRTSRKANLVHSVFLDLLDRHSFSNITNQYDCAIVFSGLTNMRLINADKELAYKINYLATKDLLYYLTDLSLPFLFVSSSAVFSNHSTNNSEISTPQPNSYYGYLKLLVENIILSEFKSCAISRVTKVICPNSIFAEWNRSLRLSLEITPFVNLNISPVHSSQYSQHLFDWCILRWSGLTHVSADKQYSYYALARRLFDQIYSPSLIKAGRFDEYVDGDHYFPIDARLICSKEHSKTYSLDEACKLLHMNFNKT